MYLILMKRNWELHDGAEDSYLNEDKDSPSDPEDNLPLAQTIPSTLTPEGHNQFNEEISYWR